MSDFETAWKIYPKYASRSKKAQCKALWQAITGPGHNAITSVEGTRLKLMVQSRPEDIVNGCKALKMSVPDDELRYIAGMQVWLNRAGFDDYDEDERKHLADLYDKTQETAERLVKAGKLRVV